MPSVGFDISLVGLHLQQGWCLPPCLPTRQCQLVCLLTVTQRTNHSPVSSPLFQGLGGGSLNFHPISACLVERQCKPKGCKGVVKPRLFSDSHNFVCFLVKQVWRLLFCHVPGTVLSCRLVGLWRFGHEYKFSKNREVFWTVCQRQVFERLSQVSVAA